MIGSNNDQEKLWIIVGASSAVGRAYAHLMASHGYDVILAGRDTKDMQASANDLSIRYKSQTQVLPLDVTSITTVDDFITQCQAISSKYVCHLFICCGVMLEQLAESERSAVYAVNYTGVAELLLRFKPIFEQQRQGNVIVLGSVAGDRGRRKNYIYGSAKAGLHTFLQGYRSDLYASNVVVTTVKPGFLDTAMTFGLPGLFAVAKPDQCAQFCYQQAQAKKMVCYYPRFWYWIMTIMKCIPESLMKRLSI